MGLSTLCDGGQEVANPSLLWSGAIELKWITQDWGMSYAPPAGLWKNDGLNDPAADAMGWAEDVQLIHGLCVPPEKGRPAKNKCIYRGVSAPG